MDRLEKEDGRNHEQLKTGQYGGIAIALASIAVAGAVASFSGNWSFPLLLVLVGIGGPAVAQAVVDRFPRRNKESTKE